MTARGFPRLGATVATLALALGSPAAGVAQQEPPALPERPLPPGAPGLPQLPPDTSGRGALTAAGAAPRRATVRDLGPGPAGRLLRDALAAPHLLVVAPDTGLTLGRDVRLDRPLLVVGTVRVAAQVQGSVIALGDLYLRPGGVVEGDAVAIGGGAYGSTLARVTGRVLAYRDLGFVATPLADGALALTVRALDLERVPTFSLPGRFGLRIPSYDRINGLSLRFGPEIALDTGRVRIEPIVTYRSHLGELDPGVLALAELTRRTLLEARVERGTFSNDAWIRADPVNSALTFAAGLDARNYYRADRGELTGVRRFETARQVLEPLVGVRAERAFSVARDSGARSVPFSVLRRGHPEGMTRANPAVTGGRITSAIVGARYRTLNEDAPVRAVATFGVEQALTVSRGGRFTQATLDGEVTMPAFRDHRFDAFFHAVASRGDSVPTQRYAYLGGSGTIPSLLLLEQGGDQLAWLESRYTVPLGFVRVPFAGTPSFTLRHIVGGAGVDRLPSLTQNLGVRLTIAVFRIDYTFDPSGRGRRNFSAGIGLR